MSAQVKGLRILGQIARRAIAGASRPVPVRLPRPADVGKRLRQ